MQEQQPWLRTGVGGANRHLLALGVPHHRDQRPVVVVDHVLARRLELREGLPVPAQHLRTRDQQLNSQILLPSDGKDAARPNSRGES